jgi:hypothetical protein
VFARIILILMWMEDAKIVVFIARNVMDRVIFHALFAKILRTKLLAKFRIRLLTISAIVMILIPGTIMEFAKLVILIVKPAMENLLIIVLLARIP